jgi:hypothetical protein
VARPCEHNNAELGSKKCDGFIEAEILLAPQGLCVMEFSIPSPNKDILQQ